MQRSYQHSICCTNGSPNPTQPNLWATAAAATICAQAAAATPRGVACSTSSLRRRPSNATITIRFPLRSSQFIDGETDATRPLFARFSDLPRIYHNFCHTYPLSIFNTKCSACTDSMTLNHVWDGQE